MFKVLLVAILALGAYAEDIVGFDFGGKFTPTKDFQETKAFHSKKAYGTNQNIKLFDVAKVETTEDGIIQSLVFMKSYTVNTSNIKIKTDEIIQEYKQILETLETRYGNFDKSQARPIFVDHLNYSIISLSQFAAYSINNTPKSNNVKRIILTLACFNDEQFLKGGDKTISLFLEYKDAFTIKAEEKARKAKTSGF